VAFGEGFGYAFAAMVLDDPNARDSFVNNGTLRSGGFNIEDNPPAANDPTGCWCSESSVWSILYDLYDGGAEAGDAVALGFGPLWDVLTDEQRITPAFTSVFSFITALRAEQAGVAAAIDSLVSTQNIVTSGITAFAATENNQPSGVASAATFPLYTTATIGGAPVVLRTVNDAGTVNKLGNHRYVRFEVASPRNVTITLSTSNPSANADPDFILARVCLRTRWHRRTTGPRNGNDQQPFRGHLRARPLRLRQRLQSHRARRWHGQRRLRSHPDHQLRRPCEQDISG
jgi:hypothetical protein